jgi:hypothetical protein
MTRDEIEVVRDSSPNDSEDEDVSRGRSRVRNENRRTRSEGSRRNQLDVDSLDDEEIDALKDVLKKMREKKLKEKKLRDLERQAEEIKRQKSEIKESLKTDAPKKKKKHSKRRSEKTSDSESSGDSHRDVSKSISRPAVRDRYSGRSANVPHGRLLKTTDAAAHRQMNGVKEPAIEVPKLDPSGANFNAWQLSMVSMMEQLGYYSHIAFEDGGRHYASDDYSWQRDDNSAIAHIRNKLPSQIAHALGDASISARGLWMNLVDIMKPATDAQVSKAWGILTKSEWDPDTPLETHIVKFDEARVAIVDCGGACPSSQWRILLLSSLKADPYADHYMQRHLYHDLLVLKNNNFDDTYADEHEWRKRLILMEREVREKMPRDHKTQKIERINNSRSVFQRLEGDVHQDDARRQGDDRRYGDDYRHGDDRRPGDDRNRGLN